MKHLKPVSKPPLAQSNQPNFELLFLLVTPLLAVYAAVGQVIRFFVPGYQKDFIGPDQAP